MKNIVYLMTIDDVRRRFKLLQSLPFRMRKAQLESSEFIFVPQGLVIKNLLGFEELLSELDSPSKETNGSPKKEE